MYVTTRRRFDRTPTRSVMLARRDDARTERTRAMEPTTRRGALETRSGGAYSPERPQTTKAREKENVAMMAAHATCTMNGSPSATWPTASTTAADAGAADTICAATLAAAALSATYAFKRDVALSSVSRTHRARLERRRVDRIGRRCARARHLFIRHSSRLLFNLRRCDATPDRTTRDAFEDLGLFVRTVRYT